MARGERSVFGVGARTATWRDVLEWARSSGELATVERETGTGLAALAREGPPPQEDVRTAGTAFRYARGLLSGDELEAWLARWELTTDDWLAHLRRTLAAQRAPGSEPRVPDEDAVWADAVCSGALERWAGELAARLAVSRGEDVDEAAYARFCEGAVTYVAVAREVASRPLEWLRVEGEQLELGDEDVAREVVLSVREDGESLAEVAVRARAELTPLATYLDDAEPELAAALLAAREHELVGPLAVGGGFVVAIVHRKAQPSADDPVLRERAAQVVLRRAIDRELEANVRWYDDV